MIPKTSVIVRTSDRVAKLEKSVQHILGMDYSNLEVIIVLDGNPSIGMFELLSRLKADSRVKVIPNCVGGMAAGVNEGLRAASGEIIAIVDDDSYPEKDWLRRSVGVMWLLNYDAVSTSYTQPRGLFYGIKNWLELFFLRRAIGVAPTSVLGGGSVILKKAVDDVGLMDTSLVKGVDMDYGIRFLRKGYRKGIVDATLVHDHDKKEELGLFGYEDKGYEFSRTLLKHTKTSIYGTLMFMGWMGVQFISHIFQSITTLNPKIMLISIGNLDAALE